MGRLRTLVAWVVAIAIVLGASAVLLTGWILVRSLPQRGGTLHVSGLDGKRPAVTAASLLQMFLALA